MTTLSAAQLKTLDTMEAQARSGAMGISWKVIASVLLSAMVLGGCKGSAEETAGKTEERARQAEKRCANRICPGDALPVHDQKTEAVFKINGQFYIAPKDYGGLDGSLAFIWPSKTPANKPGASKEAPEYTSSGPGKVSNFYEVGIEIFLRHHDGKTYGPKRYERLLNAEKEGRVISRTAPRAGLEVWRIPDSRGLGSKLWYVATEHVAEDPNGAVLSCEDMNPQFDRCTTAFRWKPYVSADMRFRAKHGADWPEIYQETIRVLSLIEEV